MLKHANRPKVQRHPERTRAQLLAAAGAEFARYGLGGARVDRIAATARANKRMLYYYFRDKEALFLAALEARYAHIRNAERQLDLEKVAPRTALKRLVTFTWNYFLEHPEFITLLNSENLHRGRHLARSTEIAKMHSPLVEILRNVLKRGEKDNVFRRGVDPVQLYISIAAESYFYLSNRYTLAHVFARDLMSPAALRARVRHSTQMIINALRR